MAPRAAGFLTVYPAGVARPTASTLNYVAGQIVPNGTVVKLGTADAVDIYALDGCPDVVVDVVGYFEGTSPTLPGGFNGITPKRLVDTRNAGNGGCVSGDRALKVTGTSPLPGIGDMIWHLPHIRAIAAATCAMPSPKFSRRCEVTATIRRPAKRPTCRSISATSVASGSGSRAWSTRQTLAW